MRRREVILQFGGAASTLASRAIAQEPGGPRRIGVLDWWSANDRVTYHGVIEALREIGYVDGRNIVVDYRGADGDLQRAAAFAADLVRSRVDLIIALTAPAAQAAKQATQAIPIVFHAVDAVASGLVASLARPGGNLTGVSLALPEVAAKWLELLREVMPHVERVAFLGSTLETNLPLRQVEASAARLGIAIQPLLVGDAGQFEGAFTAAAAGRVSAMIVQSILLNHRVAIASLALRHRLPWLSDRRDSAEVGALLAYGPERSAIYRRMAALVERILRGASPADLPIERPTRFELVINLQAARALDMPVPPSLLARADEVIE